MLTRVSEAGSSDWYRQLFESNPAVAYLVDPETAQLVDASEAAAAFWGYERASLRGMNLGEINTLPRPHLLELLGQARREGAQRREVRHRLRSGQLREVEVFTTVVRVDGRELLHTVAHDVTERRLAREALQERERLFETVSAYAVDWIFWRNPDGSLRYVSPACETISGYTPEEFLANPRLFDDVIHPEDQEKWQAHRRAPLAGDQPREFEVRIVTRAGEVRWLNHLCRAITDAQGQSLGVRGSNSDITARKRAEQYEQFRTRTLELLVRDAPLEVIFEAIVRGFERLQPGALCSLLVVDAEGRLRVGAAPGLPDCFAPVIERLQPAAVFTARRVLAADVFTEPVWADHRALAERTGVRACWSQPIVSALGKTLGAFAIFHRAARVADAADVAVIEQAAHLAGLAMERSLAAQQLRASEQRYRQFVETASEGIMVGQDGGLKFVNPKLLELTGRTAEQLTSVPFLELVHPEDRSQVKENHLKRLQGEPTPQRYAIRLLRPDGSVRWMEMSGARIDWEDRPATLNFITDITERKLAETSARLAVVGTLAAGAAHEINNPLAYILSNLAFVEETLQELGPELEESRRALGEARGGAQRVCDIVAGLKAFSRRDDSPRAATDVAQVVQSALQLTNNQLRHHATIVTRLGAVPQVLANARQLEQVFINLLVNAAQAVPPGRASAHQVTVTVRKGAAREVVIEVQDTGPGLSAEARAHLFEPFFTTKPVGSGTGLGLSICHGIVTAHDGRLEVDSAPGNGSTFRVVLPGLVDQLAQPRAAEAGVVALAAGGRVLVLDDEPPVAKAIARALKGGPEVVVVNDSRQALARIEGGEAFDLVVCDLMMPELSGEEFQQRLRGLRPALAESMIFVTGGAFTDAAADFLGKTKNACLQKPFAPNALRELAAARLPR
jgi:PAS domain S-box-containing protein